MYLFTVKPITSNQLIIEFYHIRDNLSSIYIYKYKWIS